MALACSPLGSGRLRYVFNKVLGPADAERVRLALLAEPGAAARKLGGGAATACKGFMYGWLELIYAWAQGDDPRPVSAGAADVSARHPRFGSGRLPHETARGVAGG